MRHRELSSERAALIRRALLRKALSAEYQRRALATLLELGGTTEVLAIETLAHAGRLTPSRLGEPLGLSSGGMTGLVRRLETAGCLQREAHPLDRRSVVLQLTPQVSSRLAEAIAPLVDGIDALTDALLPDEQRVVQGYLDRVADLSERHVAELRRTADGRRAPGCLPVVPSLWS